MRERGGKKKVSQTRVNVAAAAACGEVMSLDSSRCPAV